METNELTSSEPLQSRQERERERESLFSILTRAREKESIWKMAKRHGRGFIAQMSGDSDTRRSAWSLIAEQAVNRTVFENCPAFDRAGERDGGKRTPRVRVR